LGGVAGGELALGALLRWALARWQRHWFALTLSGVLLMLCGMLSLLPLRLLHEPLWLAEREVEWVFAFELLKVAAAHAGHSLLSPVFYGYWLDVLAGQPWRNARMLQRARAIPAQALVVLVSYLTAAVLLALCLGVFELTGGFPGWPESLWAVDSLLILLLPGLVYVWIGASFIGFQLAEAPRSSALAAFEVSWRLAAGRRWQLGGVLGASALIGWSGLLACGVGVLVSFPFGMLLQGALFLACKKSAAGARPVTHTP
jgi:hypothetical protein